MTFNTSYRFDDEPWRLEAECLGVPEPFFPPGGYERRDEKLAREALAKEFCGRCSVRSECLVHALEHPDESGVWGGLNEIERRNLLKSDNQDIA